MKICPYEKLAVNVDIASFFITAINLMNKQNVIYLYSGILFGYKQNEVLIHARKRMNLKNRVLSERSQSRKTTCPVIAFV